MLERLRRLTIPGVTNASDDNDYCIGRFELPLAVHAMMMGGRIRVGFEDNVYLARGVLAKSNAQLVKRIADIAAAAGLKLAAPQEARRMLGITE